MTVLSFLLSLAMMAPQPPQPTAYQQATGLIRVSAYSRGAYQYVLETTKAGVVIDLYPINLLDTIKVKALAADPARPLQVRFSGRLTGKKQVLKQATANEASATAGAIPQIKLTRIRVVE